MDTQGQRDMVLGNVTRALSMLEDSGDFSLLMPEVRVIWFMPCPEREHRTML
jgi:hypothetical protein